MNCWNGIGNVGRDPEISYTSNQMAIAVMSLGVGRGKNKNGDDLGTDWIRVKAFGKTAEVIEKYVHKGNKLGVTGKLHADSYQDRKSGETKYITEVIVDNLTFINNGQKQGVRQEVKQEAPVDDFEAVDEDVPF